MAQGQMAIEKTEGVQPEDESRMIGEGGLGAETYYCGEGKGDLPIHNRLNGLIANQVVLYIKLHQYHWHVQGHHFFTLHEKFEQLYGQTTEYMDEFAERLVAKQVKPLSTLQQFLEHATIEEESYGKKMSADEMVDDIIGDFATIRDSIKQGIKEAATVGDDATEDMLIGYKEYIDTTVWMLTAYLG